MKIESTYHPYKPTKTEAERFERFAWTMRQRYGARFSREALHFIYFETLEDCINDQDADYVAEHFEEIDRDDFCDRYEVNFHRSPEDQPDEEDEGELTHAIEQYALRNLDFYGWVPSHESLIIRI